MTRMKRVRRGERKLVTRKQMLHEISSNSRHSSRGDWIMDAEWAQLDPDFKAGKKALGAEDWNGAIAALELAALRDPLNADIQNYIGYAYRRLRQLGPAIGHYHQALMAESAPPQRA
jgi:tetratricopeptide (TPR) repeat protein